ncbi:substrate-binding domain-containing protein [Streptomyces sp. NPDC046727]|uniref:substrate-binding domain-containing protein n=1 Tax=Streptomyces sp. NPDC046727 TaxID=3155373 RepID=UPI0033C5ED12
MHFDPPSGRRRIAFAPTRGASGLSFSSNERLLGYQQALTEAGIPLDDELVVTMAADDKRGLVAGVGQLLSLRRPPTALFAEHDELAMAVIHTLRQARIEVPDRMSVIGFDDHQVAEWFDLSTVAQSPLTRTCGPESSMASTLVEVSTSMPSLRYWRASSAETSASSRGVMRSRNSTIVTFTP